ncbi:MAG: hypothetical protein ACTTJH_04705 [Bacteroidales bacterium]
MKKVFLISISIIVLCLICLTSCLDEEKYSKDSSIKLQFSSDTISFDTIFTTIGSVTKKVCIFNPENNAIKLDFITLGSGRNSYYRLNVDGDTSIVARDVVIEAKDSIFVFIRVELNPNNKSNPMLVEDSIICSFNGKIQSILLMAYGQDAYYHKPTHILQAGEQTISYSLANEGSDQAGVVVNGKDITWKNDKPHVVIGTCVVDSAFTLNLTNNTKIYMGNNADFWVYKDGTLNANGTTTNPIIFQSIRIQDRYATIPGQWGKIWLWAGSKNNQLSNVFIKNATIALLVDTCVNDNPTVKIRNTRIENCSLHGLYSRGAHIYAENLLVQNTGSYTVALTIGGSYEFIGCTFANFWSYNSTRKDATLLLNDWYETKDKNIQARKINKCNFHNTIIYGSLFENELELNLLTNNGSRYYFDHCLIKTSLLKNNNKNVVSCIFNKDPKFKDITSGDLYLEDTSPAIGTGNGVYNSIVPNDIFGVHRLDPPCIGAIENKNRIHI